MKIFEAICFCLIMIFAVTNYSEATERTNFVRGRIVDADVKTAIVGATVQVLTTEPARGGYTDKNGEFKIDGVPLGRHTLRITSIGYKPKIIDNVIVISGKETYLNVYMDESVIQTEDIKVVANKNHSESINEIITNSVVTFEPETINRFAGARGDISKIAATSAGAVSSANLRNDIIIRGNSPLGVLWMVEGAEIPNPNHFMVSASGGGIFGIINNNMLASSDFMTGAFPAEYGNKMAGAFDVKLRNGNNKNYEHTFQLGLNGLEFGSEGPFSSDSRASYVANGRFVTLQPVTAMGVDIEVDAVPEYMDGTFKVNLPTDDIGSLSVWGLGGYSNVNMKDSEDEDINWTDSTVIEDTKMRSSMYAIGMNHKCFFGDNTLGEFILSNSASIIRTEDENVYLNKPKIKEEKFEGTEGRFLAKYLLTHKFNRNILIRAGLSYTLLYYDLDMFAWNEDENKYRTTLAEKNNSGLFRTFMHWQWRPNEIIELNAGMNYQQLQLNNTKSIEPRASIKINTSETQSISFAYGLHSQVHPLLYYFYQFEKDGEMVATNKNLEMSKAHHFVLGFQESINSDFFVKAEAYYQDLYDIPVSKTEGDEYYSFSNLGGVFHFDPEPDLVNDGKGKNYGLDITLSKRMSNGYYMMLTGSLFESKYTDGLGREHSTAFDLGHVVNFLGGIEYELDDDSKYTLSADFKMTHSGGRRAMPVDIAASMAEKDVVYDNTRPYENQYDDYFALDLKIGFNINMESVTHNFFIAADNVTNQKNVFEEEWDSAENKLDKQYQLGIFPYLGYRLNF